MKTDKKTMAEIWREIENNPDAEIETNAEFIGWTKFIGFVFNPEKYLYRIKPENIIVNGVEIPKPLDVGEINNLEHDSDCYCPSLNSKKYNNFSRSFVIRSGEKLVYATKEEAIEASKKLFGIE